MPEEANALFTVTSRICVSLGFREAKRLEEEARRQAFQGEQLLEFRLDYLDDPQQGVRILREFVKRYPACKVIATCRISGLEEHLKILESAIDAGAFAFDLEIECAERAPDWFSQPRPGVYRILSYHNHECTPEMEAVVDRLQRIPADLYKIVSTAQKPTDNLAILNCNSSRLNRPVVRFAMKEVGKASRILSLARNSPFTYAAPSSSGITAPGQFTSDELRSFYKVSRAARVDRILGAVDSEMADQYAINYNLFPGCPEDLLHVPFLLDKHQLDDFIALADRLPLHGFSVHGDLQPLFAKKLPNLHETAKQSGRVNTVVHTRHGFIGIHVHTIANSTPFHNETTRTEPAGNASSGPPNASMTLIPPQMTAIQAQLWYGTQSAEPQLGRNLAW